MTKKCSQCDKTIKGKAIKYKMSGDIDCSYYITWYFCSKEHANEHYKNEMRSRIMSMP